MEGRGHRRLKALAAPAALLRPDMFRALGLLSVPYLPRQKLRPAVRFEIATQERHFYQHYFQRRGHVERELEAGRSNGAGAPPLRHRMPTAFRYLLLSPPRDDRFSG